MTWIQKYLTEKNLAEISDAIHKAEEYTNGEIVPVIVRRSSTVGHVPLTLTLLLTLMMIVAEIPYSEWLWVTPWVWLWPVILLVIYAVSMGLSQFKWVQKIFVPERDELDQVQMRAQLEFYLNRVHRTDHGAGVLIFVSVMEKKAVILADEALASKLPKETWDEMVDKLGQKLHKGLWQEGFIEAIEACGLHLQTHFPIVGERVNSLKNNLVIK